MAAAGRSWAMAALTSIAMATGRIRLKVRLALRSNYAQPRVLAFAGLLLRKRRSIRNSEIARGDSTAAHFILGAVSITVLPARNRITFI